MGEEKYYRLICDQIVTMKYDNTDIHLCYDESRKLPDETKALWLDSISKYVRIKSIKRIIDIGCGTGRFLSVLNDCFQGVIYAVDPSIKMITTAKESITTKRVTFVQCTAENLCLIDNSFDLAFLSQVYHHFQDKNKAILEIKRILRIDGFLCIRNSTVENLDSCLYLKFFPGVYEKDQKLLSSRDEMKNLLQSNDLEIVRHEVMHQKFAENYQQYFAKIKLRGLTDLALLSDNEFNQGLKKLELYCTENDSGETVFEEMDLFICRKS